MRISAKSDYAIRAMVELAASGSGAAVKAETIAVAQDIPLNFLLGILRELPPARYSVPGQHRIFVAGPNFGRDE